MDFIDSEYLISEVGKRPCLYDLHHQEYKNREYRRDNWIEVTKTVVDQYEQMDEDSRAKIVQEVQRRWKSMKDSFVKSMKLMETKGGDSKRRRPYVYHKQMSFLHSFLTEKEPVSINLPQDDLGGIDSPLVYDIPTPVDPLAPTPFLPDPADTATRQSSSKKRKKEDPLEQELLNVLRCSSQSQDPDEMFLLSQLPLIRSLSCKDKIDFQIKFMQLLKSYSDSSL